MFRSILLMAMLVLVPAAQAREVVVVMSPFQSTEQAKAQAVDVLEFLTKLEPGDKAILVDGDAITTIGEFLIPTNPAYSAPNARVNVNRKTVDSLKKFISRATPPVSDRAPRVPGALRLPQLLEFIARTVTPEVGADVLVLGSPIYDAPNDAAFSMHGERFPSDGHLLSGRSETIYGTTDYPEVLRGLRMHIVYESTPSLRAEQYRHAVQRFWSLYVEKLGGSLITFTEDLPSAFRRVTDKAAAPTHTFKVNGSRRIEMIRIVPPQAGTTIYERRLSDQPLAANDIQRAEHLEIGLSWNCARCDFDLYMRSHASAQLLHFGYMDTPDGGRYWKDFTRSPQSSGGFETITFSAPVDLRAATVLVNFYGGTASGVQAELRVSVNGQTFAGRIDFAPGSGNSAADVRDVLASGRPSAHTHIVDVLAIVNPGRNP